MANPLTNIFGRSPIKPLQQHMDKACESARLLLNFYDATTQDQWSKAEELQQQIAATENQADKIKHDIRLNLPNSLMLPMPRTDILDLLTNQDVIANISKDIAGLMLGRKMQTPAVMIDQMKEYLQASIDAAEQALKAINELDELLEAGFRGKEVDFVNNLVKELDKIEHHNDKIQISLRQKLFEIENNISPIEAVFLYKVIDRIGELADYAQRVGHRLSLLTAG